MWEVIENNKRKSIFAIILMIILFGMFGGAVGAYIDPEPTFIAIMSGIFCAVFPLILFFNIKNNTNFSNNPNMHKITANNSPKLYNIIEEITIAAGLEKIPDFYVLNSNILNAYATGTSPKNATVVVSKALIKLLNRDELQGVIAHEISHIVNRDILYMIFAGTMVSVISVVSRIMIRSTFGSRRSSSKGSGGIIVILGLIFIILSPLFSYMFYMFLSRKREYLADACAAQFTRYPQALANALKKISEGNKNITFASDDEENEKYYKDAFLNASYIIPLKKETVGDGLFSTHPATENRIRILMNMAGTDYSDYNKAYKKVTGDKGLIPKSAMKNRKK